MSKSVSTLQFVDLVILWCIIQRTNEVGEPPTTRALGRDGQLVNKFLAEHNVDNTYASPVNYNDRITEGIDKLRSLGLIVPEGRYKLTQKGKEFFKLRPLGTKWRDWPLAVPIVDGQLDLESATRAPALWY